MANTSLSFRWLGVAGIELTAGDSTVIVDPFLTRIPFRKQWFGRVSPNKALIRGIIRQCDFILVSHSHWDHLMDVPEVAIQTGATVYGSANTCELLAALGVPRSQIKEVLPDKSFSIGPFQVKVRQSTHGKTPGFSPGQLSAGLRPPLRARDYRMDTYYSYRISHDEMSFVTDPGECVDDLEAARVLFLNATHGDVHVKRILEAVVRKYGPNSRFFVPDIFAAYEVNRLVN